MSTPPVLITAHDVSVRLGGRLALERVTLAVASGEIVTVIGPNGAGKTTLIRAVLGLVPLEAGRIERARDLRVGYVPQRMSVDPSLPLTVDRFLDLPRRHPAERHHAVLAETGVPGRGRVMLQDLSGGELQRVLLARALLNDPDLLVLDEPAQGVDFGGQAELFRLIDRTRRLRACGVLLVSHDLHLVMAATDRVVCLNRHVCCSGHPQAVRDSPAYRAMMGQDAAGELAVYHHHHDHRHDVAGRAVERHDH